MSENGQDGHDGLVKVQVYLKPDLFAFVRDEAARLDLKIGPFLRTWIMERYRQEVAGRLTPTSADPTALRAPRGTAEGTTDGERHDAPDTREAV